jgi:hypothetical protein
MKCNRCGKENPVDIHTCSLPKALALADMIKEDPMTTWGYREASHEAATELRRLHAENEALECCKDMDAFRLGYDKGADDTRRRDHERINDEALLRQLQKIMGLMGADLICEVAHHDKKDRHGIGEPCPIQKRWHETITALKERLK